MCQKVNKLFYKCDPKFGCLATFTKYKFNFFTFLPGTNSGTEKSGQELAQELSQKVGTKSSFSGTKL